MLVVISTMLEQRFLQWGMGHDTEKVKIYSLLQSYLPLPFENTAKHCKTFWPTAMGHKTTINLINAQISHRLLYNTRGNRLRRGKVYIRPHRLVHFSKLAQCWKGWAAILDYIVCLPGWSDEDEHSVDECMDGFPPTKSGKWYRWVLHRIHVASIVVVSDKDGFYTGSTWLL